MDEIKEIIKEKEKILRQFKIKINDDEYNRLHSLKTEISIERYVHGLIKKYL